MPSTDLWQLAADGSAFSPACSGGVDDVVDFLERLERGPKKDRLKKLHEDGHKRRNLEREKTETEQVRKMEARQKQDWKKQKQLSERLFKNTKRRTDDSEKKPTAPPTPPPAEKKMTKKKQEEMLKRLYEGSMLKRLDAAILNEEKKIKKEEAQIRTDYPKLPDEERTAKLSEWSQKGSRSLASKRAAEYESQRNTSSADTICKHEILSQLTAPGEGEGVQLLEGWEEMSNPCINKAEPFRPPSQMEINRTRHEADAVLFKKTEVVKPKQLQEDQLPHGHWASDGARRIARKVVEEITERHRVQSWLDPGHRLISTATPDNVERQEILAQLVAPNDTSEKAFHDLAHPYKNSPRWERCRPGDTSKRDLDIDKALVFKP
eukprot:TRINITY_DN12757_c0_g1_i1.p1 TRINITY_DN12757_c0_g1~~TRINITY_DN12757_c0_g1_i1.p1  ORF type:complete len:378 (+),score=104.29 TRINITY_DN12757_c0_g1_i1:51-1184(+)